MDLIKKLGPLAFASRLKRLSEQLMRDVSRVYDNLDFDFNARWFPVGYLLLKNKEMAVTVIAEQLGFTHPAINQIAGQMTKKGLLRSRKDQNDERRRLLSLSPAGLDTMKKLDTVWKAINDSTREIINNSGTDFLKSITAIEQQLDHKAMYRRIMEKLQTGLMDNIEIVEYQPAFKKYFIKLNKQWLEKYFKIEPEDLTILSDPVGHIIDKGGHLFFARINRRVIGTVALIKHENNIFELAKMAVDPAYQRKYAGYKLAQTVIAKARKLKGSLILLQTSPRLQPANLLYKGLGFTKIMHPPVTLPVYRRKTIIMQLKLK